MKTFTSVLETSAKVGTPASAFQTQRRCGLINLIYTLARYEAIVRLKLLPRTAA